MPITITVRDSDNESSSTLATKLTFDGDRIVIGRGSGCEVRLPDRSITLRHASIRASLAEYVIVDEGSLNGTFVGGNRLAPFTPRSIKSGDLIQVGRVRLEVSIEHGPPSQDLSIATRELALSLLSKALRRNGERLLPRVTVVDGRDAGRVLELVEEGQPYAIGRDPSCALTLADVDVSREHIVFRRSADGVTVRDLGSKNGTFAGDQRLAANAEAAVRHGLVVRIGKTSLAFEEPIAMALLDLEREPDEPVDGEALAAAPSSCTSLESGEASPSTVSVDGTNSSDPDGGQVAATPVKASKASPRRALGWKTVDAIVITAAIIVLSLSIVGLVWLFRT